MCTRDVCLYLCVWLFFSFVSIVHLNISLYHTWMHWYIHVYFTFICWPENGGKKNGKRKCAPIEMAQYISVWFLLYWTFVGVFVCKNVTCKLVNRIHRQMRDWTISHEFAICCIFAAIDFEHTFFLFFFFYTVSRYIFYYTSISISLCELLYF